MDVEACRQILHDPDFEVVDMGGYFAELEAQSGMPLPEIRRIVDHLLFVNRGPTHVGLRRAALAFFSTANIRAWQPVIAARAEAAAASLEGRDEADLVEDFARIVSGDVVCRVMGLPADRRDAFDGWTDEALWLIEPLLPMRRLPGIRRALAEYRGAVEQALRDPPRQDDPALPTFLRHPIEGLGDEDRIWLAMGLYGASNVTRHTLANNLLHLAKVPPGDREVLLDPKRRMAATERLIAAGSSFETVARYVRDPDGGESRIEVPIAAASLAALEGTCPVGGADRGAPAHVAFGSGLHKCVGALLARLIIAEALTALVRRFPAFSLARPPSGFIRSVMVASPLDLHCRLH